MHSFDLLCFSNPLFPIRKSPVSKVGTRYLSKIVTTDQSKGKNIYERKCKSKKVDSPPPKNQKHYRGVIVSFENFLRSD